MLTARKRVLVVGCAGAGKSTLARRLGAITGLPVVHLDRHLWQPGWRQTLRPEWLVKLRGLLCEPRWIMDGNFRSSLALRLAAADAVIHLDFPRRICLFRVLKRVAREYGRSRPDMANGCRERLTGPSCDGCGATDATFARECCAT